MIAALSDISSAPMIENTWFRVISEEKRQFSALTRYLVSALGAAHVRLLETVGCPRYTPPLFGGRC